MCQTPDVDYLRIIVDFVETHIRPWHVLAILGVVGAAWGLRLLISFVRRAQHRRHIQTLILLRSAAIHMLQNRPPGGNADTDQFNHCVAWWEREVVAALEAAGATASDIAIFSDLVNVYHDTSVTEKIARLGQMIQRLERNGTA